MVKVLVGKRTDDRFSGFWAEFEGEEISSYKDTRQEQNIVYTLYKCTAYEFEAYRVHIANETDHRAPVYELHPGPENQDAAASARRYREIYYKEDLAEKFPLFLEAVDYFDTRRVGPQR